jgi:hypothetical protein
MSAFNNLPTIFDQAKREMRKELEEDGVNPVPPQKERPGIAVDTHNATLCTVYKKTWDGVVLRLMELDEDEETLKENLKAYYRAFDRWGLWLPIFGNVGVSYLPGLFVKAEEYFNS